MMILLSPSKKDAKNLQQASMLTNDDSELSTNLEKLKNLSVQDQKGTALINKESIENNQDDVLLSEGDKKQLAARQNAPTSMFSQEGMGGATSINPNRGQIATNQNTNGPTLAGQGVY